MESRPEAKKWDFSFSPWGCMDSFLIDDFSHKVQPIEMKLKTYN